MLSSAIADLAVLGISRHDGAPVNRVSKIVKSIVPDLWTPTVDVIDEAILRNRNVGFVLITGSAAFSRLQLTETGIQRFWSLITQKLEPHNNRGRCALEALQFFFLDGADPATVTTVLERQHSWVREQLRELKKRCKCCPQKGRYSGLWMDMERQRLEAMAEMLVSASLDHSSQRADA